MAQKISRRAFLKRTLGLGLGVGASGALGVGYSRYGEPNWLDLTHVSVPIRNLSPALDGLRIAHLSDLHLSTDVRPEHIADAVVLANQQQPDLVVLTGDFVTYGRSYIAPVAELVAKLRAPLGVYAVLGNHDYWTGAPREIMAALAAVGIRTFRNEHQRIAAGSGVLWLIGVDDVWVARHNVQAALDGVGDEGTRLVLVHEPDIADEVAQHGIDLQLSGHSHGGQVRLPFVGAPVLPRYGQRYPIGLQRVPGSGLQVYTTRGVGLVRPAYRFNCRPEVALLHLTRAAFPSP